MKRHLPISIAFALFALSVPLTLDAQAQSKSVSSNSSGKAKSPKRATKTTKKTTKGKAASKKKATAPSRTKSRQLWSARRANKKVLARRRFGKDLSGFRLEPNEATREMNVIPIRQLPNGRMRRGTTGTRRLRTAESHQRTRSGEIEAGTTVSNASTRAQAGDSAPDRERN